MLIKAYKKPLYEVLQKVEGTVSKSNTMEILKGIYFDGKKFKTTDLEVSTEIDISNYDIHPDKEIKVIFPIDFVNIIKQLPNGQVEININENTFKAEIKASGSKFKISCYDGEEYPELPEVDNEPVEFDSKILSRALDITKVSVSTDQTQPALTGIQIESNGEKSFFTSTNTYRLSNTLIDLPIPKGNLILPSPAAKEIISHCSEVETVKIVVSENYMKFIFEDVTFISRLIEGAFPNWRQVMPKYNDSKIKVDRLELLEAVKRVNIIAKKESSVIALKTDTEALTVEAMRTSDESIDTVECKLEGDKQHIDIDANYLIDFLKVLKDDVVTIEIKSPLNPLFIQEGKKDDDVKSRFLIMPVRPGA